MCRMSTDHPIDRAAAAFSEAGGLSDFAKQLGVTSQALSNWKQRGVPANYCLRIVTLAKGAVTLQELRPDDWRDYWPGSIAKPLRRARKTA